MFGDTRIQDLLATTSRLAGEVEALHQRCAHLEAQDPQGVHERCVRMDEILQAQQLQIAQLRVDNVALSERLEEEVRQARQISTALFQRLELVRSER